MTVVATGCPTQHVDVADQRVGQQVTRETVFEKIDDSLTDIGDGFRTGAQVAGYPDDTGTS